MIGSYNPILVALSILIGVLAFHAGLESAERASVVRGPSRAGWIAVGATVAGLGLCGLHTLGMLALRLRIGAALVPVGVAVPATLVAGVVGVAVMTAPLAILGRGARGAWALPTAGVLFGASVVATHFVAVAALQLPARVGHDPTLTVLAIVLAPVAAVAALSLGAERGVGGTATAGGRLGTAIALGAAAAATHYTAMAALRLTPAAGTPVEHPATLPATPGVAAAVAAAILTLLGLATIAAGLDRRVRAQLARGELHARLYREASAARAEAESARLRAEESEQRFRMLADTAPVLIWMSDRDGRRTYFNRQWLELTGRGMAEERGDGWTVGMHSDDRPSCIEQYRSCVGARQPFTLEYRLRRADGEYPWLLDTGVPRHDPHAEFVGFIGSCVDITARKDAEQRQRYLLEAARILASSLDLDAALRQVTGIFVPRFADYCIVYMRSTDGSYRQVAAAHVDQGKLPLLDTLGKVYRPEPGNPHSPVGRVIRTRQPVVARTASKGEAEHLTSDPAVLRIFSELAPTSYVTVPLIARGELIGAISLVTSTASDRNLVAADLELLELLGARAALALDTARLYTESREAHEQAVRASQLEAQLTQARLDALRAQLNPHFLFNALNTVAMLVRREAKDDALRAVVSLSEVLRRVLAGQGTQEIPLREELALVEHYLQVEQLRFRDRLSVKIDVQSDAMDASVPGLVLQPIVENAVRHGIARRAGSGRVEISGRYVDGRLLLEVRDDGPGFPDGWEAAALGRVGLANTRERLNRLYGGDHRLETRNAPSGGAVVTIELPFRIARRDG